MKNLIKALLLLQLSSTAFITPTWAMEPAETHVPAGLEAAVEKFCVKVEKGIINDDNMASVIESMHLGVEVDPAFNIDKFVRDRISYYKSLAKGPNPLPSIYEKHKIAIKKYLAHSQKKTLEAHTAEFAQRVCTTLREPAVQDKLNSLANNPSNAKEILKTLPSIVIPQGIDFYQLKTIVAGEIQHNTDFPIKTGLNRFRLATPAIEYLEFLQKQGETSASPVTFTVTSVRVNHDQGCVDTGRLVEVNPHLYYLTSSIPPFAALKDTAYKDLAEAMQEDNKSHIATELKGLDSKTALVGAGKFTFTLNDNSTVTIVTFGANAITESGKFNPHVANTKNKKTTGGQVHLEGAMIRKVNELLVQNDLLDKIASMSINFRGVQASAGSIQNKLCISCDSLLTDLLPTGRLRDYSVELDLH